MSATKSPFKLHSPFKPSGSQPEAIKQLVADRPGNSVLLGVTGSGKTFSLASTIAQQSKQVLVLSPNKTLAAQLYEEFSLFFPENKVCYFVSYYDYYQPESYLPAQDIYIPKETKINSELDRLRIEATASIINRPDTIVIASVSAIYSLGNPWDYRNLAFAIKVNDVISRRDLINKLIFIQYKRNEVDKDPGTFQVQGNVLIIQLPYQRDAVRVELFGDIIESIELVDRKNYTVVGTLDNILIFPSKHFVTTQEKKDAALGHIGHDLEVDCAAIENPLYRERLKTRVSHDMEMIKETGYCSGIENYSRYFDGRTPGDAPYCLFDFFDKDFLLVLDESHITIPQLRGMYNGDRARKKALIEYGFRLTSAYDNRPLQFEEIERYFKDAIFVSATPGAYERERATAVVEQIVRPTGIVDPAIEILPRENQLVELLKEIKSVTDRGFRTLVTTLTKKSAEELAGYLEERKIKVCYLHSDIKTPQRTEILHKLRNGTFDVLVGINLLREGLDLPEVALVAIMDADIEGFLRDTRSLIQTIGRAARNAESKVIMFADKMTGSMEDALKETSRRRDVQMAYNKEHGIVPVSVTREVPKSISKLQQAVAAASKIKPKVSKTLSTAADIEQRMEELKIEMSVAAEELDFEKAIKLRDELLILQARLAKTPAD